MGTCTLWAYLNIQHNYDTCVNHVELRDNNVDCNTERETLHKLQDYRHQICNLFMIVNAITLRSYFLFQIRGIGIMVSYVYTEYDIKKCSL